MRRVEIDSPARNQRQPCQFENAALAWLRGSKIVIKRDRIGEQVVGACDERLGLPGLILRRKRGVRLQGQGLAVGRGRQVAFIVVLGRLVRMGGEKSEGSVRRLLRWLDSVV